MTQAPCQTTVQQALETGWLGQGTAGRAAKLSSGEGGGLDHTVSYVRHKGKPWSMAPTMESKEVCRALGHCCSAPCPRGVASCARAQLL